MDISLDSALSWYSQQAGVSSFPAFTKFFFSFILSKLFPTISIDLFDLFLFEEKGQVDKAIVTMFMSISPWSLASITIVFGV